jgi:hypothetical protein
MVAWWASAMAATMDRPSPCPWPLAPPAGHGYGAHRLLGKLALPRPVTAGLAAPLTRPARSAVTLAAITFGLTAVVLATGLDTSLARDTGAVLGVSTQ